jgi:hypothetical protein
VSVRVEVSGANLLSSAAHYFVLGVIDVNAGDIRHNAALLKTLNILYASPGHQSLPGIALS